MSTDTFSNTAFRTELVTNYNDFVAMQNEWNNLVENNDYDITLLHEWLTTWWEVFGDEGRELFIVTVRKNDVLLGVAPFLRRKVTYFKLIPRYRLEFLGSGENECDEICSDYLDFIIDSNNRSNIMNSIIDHLLSADDQWQEIVLTDIKENSLNLKIFKDKLTKASIKIKQQAQVACPYIELPNTWDELKKATKINSREQLNRKQRLLEKEGNVEYKEYRGNTISPEIFYSFIQLHQKRWTSAGKPGSFNSKKFTTFHQNIIKKISPRDFVSLYFVYLNNKPIVARYCFNFNNIVYDYLPGLDPDINKRLSPGLLGLAYTIEQSINTDNKKFDFLKGKSGSYKYKWTDLNSNIAQYRVHKTTIGSFIIELIENTTNHLKALKNLIPTTKKLTHKTITNKI